MNGRIKQTGGLIELEMTADELRRLEAVAAYDRRDPVQQLLWLIEAYSDGRLRIVDDGEKRAIELAKASKVPLSRYTGLKSVPNPDGS